MANLKVDHIMIGAKSLEESQKFYSLILEYRFYGMFTDTVTQAQGSVLVRDSGPELLIVPMPTEKLPSPQHLAFDVDPITFEKILVNCKVANLSIRSEPALDSEAEGVGEFFQAGKKLRHFYFCDPTRLNFEILTRTEA